MSDNFKELRENFGLFATGVSVVTTYDGENVNAITINSLSSVSLDPALLLFCIDNNSSNFEAFTKNNSFAVNILSDEQKDLSQIFAKHGNLKSSDISHKIYKSDNDNFLIKDSLGFFECERYQVFESGDHHIIVGKIHNFSKDTDSKKPLIYFKGDYNSLS